MSSKTQQDSFDTAQRSEFDSHPLPNLEKRPGLRGESGFNRGLDGRNLLFVDRYRDFACSYHMHHPRNRQDWQAIQRIEVAKDVSRKKRKLDFLKPVGPPVLLLIQRQERFQSPNAQVPCDQIFVLASYSNRVPMTVSVLAHCSSLQDQSPFGSTLLPDKLPPLESRLPGPHVT